jgi:hypothetical protein
MTIRSTYALDVDTVRTLEEIARRWGVSKSEALRRAVRASATSHDSPGLGPEQALDELQRSMQLSPAAARAWTGRVRQERRAALPERGK